MKVILSKQTKLLRRRINAARILTSDQLWHNKKRAERKENTQEIQSKNKQLDKVYINLDYSNEFAKYITGQKKIKVTD